MKLLIKAGLYSNHLNTYSNFEGAVILKKNVTEEETKIEVHFGKNIVQFNYDLEIE
jgi:hypothetical protein